MKELTATSMRTLLRALLVVIIIAAIGGFYFGLQQVRVVAVDVTHTSEDASASNEMVERIAELQAELVKTRALVEKADTMFVPVANYQVQAVTDLRRYADASGISITETDFGEPDVAANSTATGETRPVTVTLAQPVTYASLVRFLQLTEGSLPKMTVNGIQITRSDTGNKDQVTVAPITLRISVK